MVIMMCFLGLILHREKMLLQDMERSQEKENNQVGSLTSITTMKKQKLKVKVKEENFESWLGSLR